MIITNYEYIKSKIVRNYLIILALPIIIVGLLRLYGPLYVNYQMVFGGNISQKISSGLVSGLPSIDPTAAQYTLALGTEATRQVISGKIPLWNHYQGFGQPLLGDMVSASLFPPTWLMLLENGQVIIQLFLQFLGGIGAYLFFKKIGLRNSSCIIGGILFEFNGVYAWLQNQCFNPICFFPWILYACEALTNKNSIRKSFKYIIITAIAGSLANYAGFPETVYLYTLFIIIFIIIRLLQKNNLKWQYILSYGLIGILGFGLSAPILLAFYDYFQYANVGGHSGDGFSKVYNSRLGILNYFFPYAYGPIFAIPNIKLYEIWGSIGGYIGFFCSLCAVATIFNPKDRCIKIYLMMWVLITISVSHGVPYITPLFFEIPLMKIVAVSRYLNITWIFCLIYLTVLFMDELGEDESCKNSLIKSFIICLICLAIYFIFIDKVELINLLSNSRVRKWFLISILIILVLGIYLIYKNNNTFKILKLLILSETILLSCIPLLSYPRAINFEQSLVDFLKNNIEYQRFVQIPDGNSSILVPNFGSYYQISQLNYDGISSKINSDYINKHLDSFANANMYLPDFPTDINKQARINEFLRNLNFFAEVGTKYVLAYKKENSWDVLQNNPNNLINFDLESGDKIELKNFPTIENKNLAITSIELMIGNYNNKSNGSIKISLCSNKNCVHSLKQIDNSLDNKYLIFNFDRDILINTKDISITVEKISGTEKVAIWSKSNLHNYDINLNGYKSDFIPAIKINYGIISTNPLLKKAYSDSNFNIYELSGFKKYLSSDNCSLQLISRDKIIADCYADSSLVRLESNMPGWSAYLNGAQVNIDSYGEIFQSVKLPQGRSIVSFSFTPKFFIFSCYLFLITILFIIISYFFVRKAN